MATLAANSPLSNLADILHAAIALSPDAWQGTGSRGDGASRGSSNLTDDLKELFALLQQRKTAHVLVGGVALLRYVDGRNTQDIDLLISLESLQRVPEIVIADRNKEFARARFKSLAVDLLLTVNPLFKLVAEKYATVHPFAEIPVPCATVEGLILLKLYALPSLYRQGDGQRIGLYETDIFLLCQRHNPNIANLMETLRQFVGETDFQELTNIAADIQRRITRVDSAKKQP